MENPSQDPLMAAHLQNSHMESQQDPYYDGASLGNRIEETQSEN